MKAKRFALAEQVDRTANVRGAPTAEREPLWCACPETCGRFIPTRVGPEIVLNRQPTESLSAPQL
jgi:hypothetical protein